LEDANLHEKWSEYKDNEDLQDDSILGQVIFTMVVKNIFFHYSQDLFAAGIFRNQAKPAKLLQLTEAELHGKWGDHKYNEDLQDDIFLGLVSSPPVKNPLILCSQDLVTTGGFRNQASVQVGPNVQGNREGYQLVRRLQGALFGGVYEAKGLTSNKDFAIKILYKSKVTKAQELNSIEFCEVPLNEISFAERMRGHKHVMELEEHFEDEYCFYVVSELCRGGDLLEALRQKRRGFDEARAQYLIKQAALGLAFLHERHVAMQDVSLENLLLNVQRSTGHYEVKVCDPGQAVIFDVDKDGQEMPVNFRGLVGKSFRPPELYEQQSYFSTKVDSWFLGWSTFYLLTAQPLFMSADPAQQDSDWLLFQNGNFAALYEQKCKLCSPIGLDFISRLLEIEPGRRMSIAEALNHPWLNDAYVAPVLGTADVLVESIAQYDHEEPCQSVRAQSDDGVIDMLWTWLW